MQSSSEVYQFHHLNPLMHNFVNLQILKFLTEHYFKPLVLL